MEQWCLEHPFMTFIILFVFVMNISIGIGRRSCDCSKKGDSE